MPKTPNAANKTDAKIVSEISLQKLGLAALEPRILLDAAAMLTGAEIALDTLAQNEALDGLDLIFDPVMADSTAELTEDDISPEILAQIALSPTGDGTKTLGVPVMPSWDNSHTYGAALDLCDADLTALDIDPVSFTKDTQITPVMERIDISAIEGKTAHSVPIMDRIDVNTVEGKSEADPISEPLSRDELRAVSMEAIDVNSLASVSGAPYQSLVFIDGSVDNHLDTDSDNDGMNDAAEAAGFNENEGISPLDGTLPDTDVDASKGTTAPLFNDLDSGDQENPPILDLNSTASASDSDRGIGVSFGIGDAPIAIVDVDGDALGGDTNADFTALTITPSSTFPDGTAEILQIAGVDFPLGVDKVASGITIPGTSAVVDISYRGGVITIREASNGVIANADMDTLIRSVTYRNTNGAPDESVQRTFDFQVAQYDPASFVIDFEELTPGTQATAAQIGSDPWWARASALNGLIQDANNAGRFNQTLANNADGTFLFHNTSGNVPNGERIVFGRDNIPVEANQDYNISIDIGRQNRFSAGPFEVLINGIAIGTINVNNGPIQDWQTLSFNF